MDRDEILKEAKYNQNKGKEFENRIAIQSGSVDVLVTIVVVLILILTEYFIKRTFNLEVLAVAFSIVSADCLYMGIKNKQVWRIICGALLGLLAIFVIIAFVNNLVTA